MTLTRRPPQNTDPSQELMSTHAATRRLDRDWLPRATDERRSAARLRAASRLTYQAEVGPGPDPEVMGMGSEVDL